MKAACFHRLSRDITHCLRKKKLRIARHIKFHLRTPSDFWLVSRNYNLLACLSLLSRINGRNEFWGRFYYDSINFLSFFFFSSWPLFLLAVGNNSFRSFQVQRIVMKASFRSAIISCVCDSKGNANFSGDLWGFID